MTHKRHEKSAKHKTASISFTSKASEVIRQRLDSMETCVNIQNNVSWNEVTMVQ